MFSSTQLSDVVGLSPYQRVSRYLESCMRESAGLEKTASFLAPEVLQLDHLAGPKEPAKEHAVPIPDRAGSPASHDVDRELFDGSVRSSRCFVWHFSLLDRLCYRWNVVRRYYFSGGQLC